MSEFDKIEIREISKERAKKMVFEYHYTKYLPQLNDFFLGGFIDDELCGVMTLGWGVRPKHTIQKLFPSLGVDDYRSIGRMALVEELPHNSESHFISQCIKHIKRNYDFPVLFTWADGMLARPGFIYQAANFWYGGYIWTDTYVSGDGEKVHPRQTNRIGGRPSFEELQELDWKHYRGKQFRYVYFLDDEKKDELLTESDQTWTQGDYPKHSDLSWKVRTEDGWVEANEPDVDPHEMSYNGKKGKELQAHQEQHELGAFTGGQRWERYQPPEAERFELGGGDE